MFSFLQQLVPKRRGSVVADDDDFVDSAEATAWVPPAPLAKAPPSDDEVAAAEREAEAAAKRAEERRAEEQRAVEASLAEERRLAEERLAERERVRIEAERRADEARAAEEAREVERRERERAEREEAERAEAQAHIEAQRLAQPAPVAEHVEPTPAVAEHVEHEPAVAEHVESEPAVAEPVESEPVVADHIEPAAAVAEPAEPEGPSYTWPATLLRHAVPMHYGEAARRNLLATVSHLSDEGLDLVLGDALYEEAPDGLRPEVLAVLRASYHGDDLRATYQRFVRIGSSREREIARDGLAALDRAADVARSTIPAET